MLFPDHVLLAGTRERAGRRRGQKAHVRGGPGQRRSAIRIAPGGIGFAPEMIALNASCRTFNSCQNREASMTAYLISLALAGLIAIAVWEGLS